jgi:hypothetical protein
MLFDTGIHQIFQEKITETERGMVDGAQNSLNKIFDMVKN